MPQFSPPDREFNRRDSPQVLWRSLSITTQVQGDSDQRFRDSEIVQAPDEGVHKVQFRVQRQFSRVQFRVQRQFSCVRSFFVQFRIQNADSEILKNIKPQTALLT